jgi:hypothetical protein
MFSSLLYFNHQVHRDFLFTLYYTVSNGETINESELGTEIKDAVVAYLNCHINSRLKRVKRKQE